MLKAYKYRPYPNEVERELMAKHFGYVRHIYNWGLAEKNTHYQQTAKSLSKRALQDCMVASKKEEKKWLCEINS